VLFVTSNPCAVIPRSVMFASRQPTYQHTQDRKRKKDDARKKMYVRLIEHHPKNPAVVDRLTNQLHDHSVLNKSRERRRKDSLEHRRSSASYIHERQKRKRRLHTTTKNISRQSPQPQPTHGEELTAVSTAASGSPFDVQYVKYFGACPRSANPYRIRDEQNRKLFPAENALVNTQALMMCGRTE
jgi:hypothetical protein